MAAPEQAEKRHEHFALAKAPDWKYTPLKPDKGTPVPYWTIAYFDEAVRTAPGSDGRGNEYFIERSRVPTSRGGEAGKGKGVISGTYMDEFEPKEWSGTLRIDQGGAVFNGHMGTINKGNAPAKVYTSINPEQAIADKACWEQMKTNMAALGVASKDRMFADPAGCGKDVLSGAWNTITGDVAAVGDMLGNLWGGITAFFSDPLGSMSSAVDGLQKFGAQAVDAGKQVVGVIEGLRDGSITMDDLLDFAADMLQDQLCEMAALIEEMVKQGKGCEAVGVILGQTAEAVAVSLATAGVGAAAGGATKAAQLLAKAGIGKGDDIASAIAKLKEFKRKQRERPHAGGEHPKAPTPADGNDSSTPGYKRPLPCPVCPQVGDPVNPVQGCKVLAGELDMDFDLASPLALRWQRTYVSSNPHVGWLGQGWSLALGIAIQTRRAQQGSRLVVIDEFGREIEFPMLGPGASHYNDFEKMTLAAPDAQRLELIGADGAQRMVFRTLPGRAGALPRHVLEAVMDRNDNAIRIAYGEHGLPSRITDAAGRTLLLAFEDVGGRTKGAARDPVHRLSRVDLLDAGGAGRSMLVGYGYSPEGDLIQVTDALGNVAREFQYRHHMMVRHSHAGAMWSSYVYDTESPSGRVIRSENSSGGRQDFEYLPSRTLVKDQLGRIEIYEFNHGKEWTATVDALGGRTVRELDAFGNLIALTDPAGRTTRYAYDAKGRTTRIQEPGSTALDSLVTMAVYDEGSGLPASITDPAGGTARYRYDARGNLLEMQDALGRTTLWEYDARGLPVTVVDALGKTRRMAYNAAGQIASHTDCSGQTTRLSYDAWGHLSSSVDAMGQTVNYRHDALGRLLSVQQPDGATELNAYDAAGRLVAHTDPTGARTEYTLAADGLPLVRKNALGGQMRYEYDAARRLVALYNENGARCDFGYDPLDRVVEETGFDGRHMRYRYDPAGLLTGKLELGCLGAADRLAQRLAHQRRSPAGQDGRTLPPQRTAPTYEDPWGLGLADEIGASRPLPGHAIVTTFVRDAAGRLVEKQVAGHVLDLDGQSRPQTKNTRYRYDDAGRLVEAANHAGSRTTLAYDALGQLTQETRVGQGIGSELLHRYDVLGNRTGTVLPDGSGINWLYYGSGHLHQINVDGQVICDIERDALHREVGRSQGALSSRYRYDPGGRLSAQTAWMSEALSQTPSDAAVRAVPVLSRRYGYDAGGNLLSIADRRRGETRYSYDGIGRLTTAVQAGSSERFAFDPAHNLLPAEPNIAGGAASTGSIRDNRLEVFEDKRYRYDSHGNLIEKKVGKHTVIRLSWDVEHQLSGSLTLRNGAAQQTRYAYDAFGRRVEKADAFGQSLYTWDGDQLLSEQRGGNRTLYLYEPGGLAPLAQVCGQEIRRPEPPARGAGVDIAANDSADHDDWQPRKTKTLFAEQMLAAQKALAEKVRGRASEGEGEPAAAYPPPVHETAARAAATWRVLHYHNDHLGTPRELTDADGRVVWSAAYKAWGNTLRAQDAQPEARLQADSPGAERRARAGARQREIEQNLRFQGHYFDTETGLHYNRFRYYDPDIGRFVSQDPIGLDGAQNLYMYAPNPTGWIDLFGLSCLKWNAGSRRWQNATGRFVRLPTRDFFDKAMALKGFKRPPAGFKANWLDGGYKYEVRAHPANPAHGSTGSIYRVSRQMPGKGEEYMDIHGCWHHASTLKETFKDGSPNPIFNSAGAADTHIPY